MPPRDADAAWARALIFLAPAWLDPSSPDVQRYFDSLSAVRDRARWALRAGAVLAPDSTRPAFESRLRTLGLIIVPPAQDARLTGHAVAASCRTAVY